MAAKKSKSDKIVEKNMREVFTNPPSTLKPGQGAEAGRQQQVAIGLAKSREAGAAIPENPRKRGSKASY